MEIGILFILVSIWAIYTLYNYYKSANYTSILILIALYAVLSLFFKNKSMALFLAVLFTNMYFFYSIIKSISKKT